jgi:hypothetical protein
MHIVGGILRFDIPSIGISTHTFSFSSPRNYPKGKTGR